MARVVRHPIFARLYAALSPRAEARGMGEQRAATVEGLSGRVLEVGAGTGLMFPHYPPAVTEVVAVEPEEYLRRRAAQAAARAPVRVGVHRAVAERLPCRDAEFDAVVFALVLCSVRDPAAALAEARRVLAPGGELRFLEHVRPHGRWGARVAGALDRSGAWPLLGGGCHLSRDTASAIRAAGFTIDEVDEVHPAGEPLPVPFIRGRALLREREATANRSGARSPLRPDHL